MSDLAALWEQSRPSPGSTGAKGQDEDLSAVWASAAPAPKPGPLEILARSGGQGITNNFSDELTGAAQAAQPAGGTPWWLKSPIAALAEATSDVPESQRAAAADIPSTGAGGAGDQYRQPRDSERAANRAAREANPALYTAGEIGGAALQSFIPGLGTLGAGRTLARSMGGGAAVGAISGLGASEADLTKGDVGGAVEDMAIGAAAGGVAGAAAHGVGRVVGAIRNRAGQGVRLAEADAAQKAVERAQGAVRVARSSVGGEAAAGLNAVAKAEEVAANASSSFTPAQVAQARAWLATPEALALRQNAAQNVLDRGAGRLGGSLQSAQNVLQGAEANATPRAVEAAAAADLANPIRRELAPRAWTLGHRLLPVALAGIGAAVGGPEGAAVGTGLGAVMALTQGRPGIMIRNAIRSPGVRKLVWEFVESAARGGMLSRFGPMLQRALTEGGTDGGMAIHEALMSERSEYLDEVGNALLETGGEQ